MSSPKPTLERGSWGVSPQVPLHWVLPFDAVGAYVYKNCINSPRRPHKAPCGDYRDFYMCDYSTAVLQYYSTTLLQYCITTVLRYYITTVFQYYSITLLQYYSTTVLQYYSAECIV